MTIIYMHEIQDLLVYGWPGGHVIAVAVFVVGPWSFGTAESVSLRHFLRGLVTQSFGLQFGGAMGLGVQM